MDKKHKHTPRIGIDIGKVIMSPVTGGKSDTSFLSGDLQRAMKTPPAPYAFEGVKTLVDAFEGRAWLISKAGPNIQFKTKEWLKYRRFFVEADLPRGNVRFCLRRPEKAGHCKQLKITHFRDDRLDVLEYLRDIVPVPVPVRRAVTPGFHP